MVVIVKLLRCLEGFVFSSLSQRLRTTEEGVQFVLAERAEASGQGHVLLEVLLGLNATYQRADRQREGEAAAKGGLVFRLRKFLPPRGVGS